MKRLRTQRDTDQGFTLIEIMVSISIFAIIMVTGIGALLTLTRAYQTSRDESNVTNAIHFALDSMVRDIRLGDSYYAGTFTPQTAFGEEYRYNDDSGNRVLNLMGIPSRGQLRYTFDPNGSGPYLSRYQYVDGEEYNYPLLTQFKGVTIERGLFRVVGSDPSDDYQPSVFINIRGVDDVSGNSFVLQTFVSQRNPDL